MYKISKNVKFIGYIEEIVSVEREKYSENIVEYERGKGSRSQWENSFMYIFHNNLTKNIHYIPSHHKQAFLYKSYSSSSVTKELKWHCDLYESNL